MICMMVAGMLILIGGILTASPMFWEITARKSDPSSLDQSFVAALDDLAPWLPKDYQPQPAFESSNKILFLDGTWDIRYEYSGPNDDYHPYLRYTASQHRSPSAAREAYSDDWSTLLGELWRQDLDLVDMPPPGLGEQQRLALLTANGDPIGNLFIARQGDRVVIMLVSGVYFANGRDLAEMAGPAVSRFFQER